MKVSSLERAKVIVEAISKANDTLRWLQVSTKSVVHFSNKDGHKVSIALEGDIAGVVSRCLEASLKIKIHNLEQELESL